MQKKERPHAAGNSARPDSDLFDALNLAQPTPAVLFAGPPEDHIAAIQQALPLCSLCGRPGPYFYGCHRTTWEEVQRWGLGWIAYACCFYCTVDRETPKRLLAHFDFLFASIEGPAQ